MMYRTVLAASFLLAAVCTSAQVEVVDRKIPKPNAISTQARPVDNAAELHYQLQVLQQEVLQLRGMVEEQSFEIKKLKQQRLDDYLDLDRRLSQLGQAGVARSTAGSASTTDSKATTAVVSAPAPAEELESYKSAINLVLKEKKYDEAVNALNTHLSDYPRGRYSANAQYWLGEIYLLKNDLEPAREWFARLIDEYPQHSKVPDAQYKLGKVYAMLGDKASARSLLETVAQSDTNAARLARDYLDNQLTN